MFKQLSNPEPTILVAAGDVQAQPALAEMAESSASRARICKTAQELFQAIDSLDRDTPGCVVSDLCLPDLDGVSLQRRLNDRQSPLAVIFVAAKADTATTVRVMRNGAVAVLDGNYRPSELAAYVDEALAISAAEVRRRRYQRELEDRFKRLSPQDRQVLQLILEGCKNRSMAKRLEVSLRTVENRRRRVFDVMQAESVAELTRMVVAYEHRLPPAEEANSPWMALPFERVA
jgi:two-component system response regulator FixJ